MRVLRKLVYWLFVASNVGCGSDATAPAGPGGYRLIAWGATDPFRMLARDLLAFGRPLDDLVLIGNLVEALAGEAGGGARILYSGCDPRSDVARCGLQDLDTSLFFLQMERTGTIEFGDLPSAPELSSYDVVIANFCHAQVSTNAARDALADRYRVGGPILVLADNSCLVPDPADPSNPSLLRYSAIVANEFLEPIGIRFTNFSPVFSAPTPVPPEAQVGLLQGVSEVYLFETTPVTRLDPSIEFVLETPIAFYGAARRFPPVQ